MALSQLHTDTGPCDHVIDKKVGCFAVSRLNGETDLLAAYLGPLDGAAVRATLPTTRSRMNHPPDDPGGV